jgi:hypothetical protein
VLKTLDVILRAPKPFQLQLFSLCLYQGTQLHERAKKDGLLFMDPRIDDYGRLSSTTLNRLMQMTPTVPAPVIRYFIRHRKSGWMAGVIQIVSLINTLVLAPVSFLRLMHRAYGARPLTTARVIKNFYGTALRKILHNYN